jgi:hypothetical protein
VVKVVEQKQKTPTKTRRNFNMFEAETQKPSTYEPAIGEQIKIDGLIYECKKQMEERGRSGCHCDPCDFYIVCQSDGQLSTDCAASDAVHLFAVKMTEKTRRLLFSAW